MTTTDTTSTNIPQVVNGFPVVAAMHGRHTTDLLFVLCFNEARQMYATWCMVRAEGGRWDAYWGRYEMTREQGHYDLLLRSNWIEALPCPDHCHHDHREQDENRGSTV